MFSIIYITAGDLPEARKIGRILVEERLAACVISFKIEDGSSDYLKSLKSFLEKKKFSVVDCFMLFLP
jgi:uncharacterized protein involved in tolerance to divalent cations